MKLFRLLFITLTYMEISVLAYGQKLTDKITPVPESNKNLDIPRYKNGKPFVFWHFCKQKETQLNLILPETSEDSIVIRMWLTVQTKKKGQRHDLVEIRFTNNEWVAQVINMYVDFKTGKLQETINVYSVTNVNPVTDWKTITDSLFFWKIDSLPTDERLPDYALKTSNYGNRAPTFSFEYSTPTTYRFYQYNNVWTLQDYYWQAGNVVNIINLIDREFQVDSLALDFYEKKVKK